MLCQQPQQQIVEHKPEQADGAEHHEFMPAVWHAAKIKNPGQAKQVVSRQPKAEGKRGRDEVMHADMLGQVIQAGKIHQEAEPANIQIADELPGQK